MGNFNHGLFDGKGEIRWRNGDVYFGDFKDHMRHGLGKMFFENGD